MFFNKVKVFCGYNRYIYTFVECNKKSSRQTPCKETLHRKNPFVLPNKPERIISLAIIGYYSSDAVTFITHTVISSFLPLFSAAVSPISLASRAGESIQHSPPHRSSYSHGQSS